MLVRCDEIERKIFRGGSLLFLAAQIVERCRALWGDDTKAGVRSDGIGILKSVPVDGGVAEKRASNLIPVCLSVAGRWNGKVLSLAANGPASLGDPYGLALSVGDRSLICLLEQALALADGVVEGILKIWVCVSANEVGSLDNSAVRIIDPCSPGINVTNWNMAKCGPSDRLLDLLDEVGHSGWACTNARLVDDTSG